MNSVLSLTKTREYVTFVRRGHLEMLIRTTVANVPLERYSHVNILNHRFDTYRLNVYDAKSCRVDLV